MRAGIRYAQRALLAAALGVALACTTSAATPSANKPSAKQGHPDLSGFWNLSGKVPRDQAMIAKLPANTVLLEDTGAAEFPLGEYGGLKVKAKALEAAKRWNPRDDLSIANACKPPSIVYAMQGPFPMEVYQGTELIIFKLEYFDMVRIVFMDGRPRPGADYPHSKTGFSLGRWEGDTLVVETTHLEPATITNNGLSHSENVKVIEHFKLSADGTALLATQEFEDPDTLDNRGARFIAWKRKMGDHVYPYDCDPSFALQYQNSNPQSPNPK